MLKLPTKTEKFACKKEEGLNPYIGFVSFQHFRGENLYSDIVVEEKNKRTETERIECYPISADAEDDGRKQGYYPDATVAYFRVLWKEFEAERGVYNYDFIQSIIDEAKAHGQTLNFRLMAHSTRECDDLPEWLKEMIPCPERPPMMRVKDSPTDPLFMQLFLEAVRALGEKFDSNPWLDAVDISLPGAWGEGYKLDLYPDDLFMTIVDTYATAFPTTRLFTQISKPHLVEYARKYTNVGWRGDGLGDPYHTTDYYPPMIEKMPEQWKVAPVSFESYWWLCEWKRQGWDIDEIIDKTLRWHISTFNPKSMPIPYEWRDKCEYWISRMGYHFTINSVAYPDLACRGDRLSVSLNVENTGVAPVYKKLTLILRLKSSTETYDFLQPTDVRRWLPGKSTEALSIDLSAQNVPSGNYELEISLACEHADVVYFATDAVRDGAFYKIGNITVE